MKDFIDSKTVYRGVKKKYTNEFKQLYSLSGNESAKIYQNQDGKWDIKGKGNPKNLNCLLRDFKKKFRL